MPTSLSPHQTFLWDQDQVVVPWLESQVSSPSSSVRENAECVKKEFILRQLHRLVTVSLHIKQPASLDVCFSI